MIQRIAEADLSDNARRKIRKLETGREFGRLTVIGFAYLAERAYWNCQCECGEVVPVSSQALTRNNTRSCGCLRRNNFLRNRRSGSASAAKSRIAKEASK